MTTQEFDNFKKVDFMALKASQPNNTLAILYPNVSAEWDYEKNKPLRPETVAAHSGKNAWWICNNGHCWNAKISNRTSKGYGCPFCSGRYPVKGKTDLSTLYPDIAAEWDKEKNDTLTPEMVTAYSRKKIWWICSQGHSWAARISDRTCKNQGCPYCSGRKAIPGKTDLVSLFPSVAAEWDYDRNGDLSPATIAAHSGKSVWWICRNGHSWKTIVQNRTTRGSGCPYCSGHAALPDTTNLLTIFPDIAAQWDYEKNGAIIPEETTPYSHRSVWWICDQGHRWQTTVKNRTAHNSCCPYCSGQRPIRGQTDLPTICPNIAKEWDAERNGDLHPEMVTAHSGRKVWWVCNKGHSWEAKIVNRTRKGRGCPYCSGHKAIPFETDLNTLFPDIAAQWDYNKNGSLLPEFISAHSGQKIWWICSEGHGWLATVNDRTRSNSQCPYCTGRRKQQKTIK